MTMMHRKVLFIKKSSARFIQAGDFLHLQSKGLTLMDSKLIYLKLSLNFFVYVQNLSLGGC